MIRLPRTTGDRLIAAIFSSVLALLGCVESPEPAQPTPASYLFVWSGDLDEQDSDFMTVVDARPSEPTYGQVVATLPVGERATMPHHTEYEYPASDTLFANGWTAGQTFLIDVRNPLRPTLAGQFEGRGGFSFPHSFARLPGGNVLATFQGSGDSYAPPGGLVELDVQGRLIRTASAATPDVDSSLTWPYSVVVIPEMDRAVSTLADMGVPPWDDWIYHDTYQVQIWSVSDLRLVATVPLPEVDQGPYHIWPAEPRVLRDGTVYVSTFRCGLYRLHNVESDQPSAEFVHAFPGGTPGVDECAVPLVYGNYWIQTVPALPGLIVLDVRDPARPVEASRLELGEQFPMPHWVAADRASGRLVVTGAPELSWVLMLNFDAETGRMTIDENFRDSGAAQPGVTFQRDAWPHGNTGPAVVHGALFGG
jgi:hypothetical protein